jgi:hypothetical protein
VRHTTPVSNADQTSGEGARVGTAASEQDAAVEAFEGQNRVITISGYRRSTVEVLPALWWFTANHDYLGQTLTTDVLFQLDAHVPRDLTASYMKLVSSGSPDSLKMDRFSISLIYGWHSLVEGARRLEEGKK